jgi:hypothetical protein
VGPYITIYQADAAFVLDRAEWDEVAAFDKRRRARLYASVHLPALVLRDQVFTIETLVLAITNDLASDTPSEMAQVDEDGVLTPYP